MSYVTEHFLGTLVNFAVVLIAGILGALIRRGIPKRISDAIMAAMAICVIYIGIDGVLEEPPSVPEGSLLSAGLVKVLVMIISMALGTLIGELIDLEGLVERLGKFIEGRLGARGEGNFAQGFVNCSLLFCVGAMAINGSIESAQGNHEILLAKSVIDGISCFIMATTLGIGCAFSSIPLLLYQGGIGILALLLLSSLSPAAISYMTATGSLIIILVGTNVLGITRVRTANMVPAMLVSLGVSALISLVF